MSAYKYAIEKSIPNNTFIVRLLASSATKAYCASEMLIGYPDTRHSITPSSGGNWPGDITANFNVWRCLYRQSSRAQHIVPIGQIQTMPRICAYCGGNTDSLGHRQSSLLMKKLRHPNGKHPQRPENEVQIFYIRVKLN